MKKKLFLPIIFITFMLPLLFCGCNYGGDDNDYEPIYQDAIYIMDADGSNKQKVIDVDNCDNVQFIPNSNKLLYLADNSLYTVNEDGIDNTKISGNLEITNHLPVIKSDGQMIALRFKYVDNTNIGLFDMVSSSFCYLSNKIRKEDYPTFSSNEEFITYAVRDTLNQPFYIAKLYVTTLLENTIFSSTSLNSISETYLNNSSNKLYFTEANYRGNASLIEYNLDNQTEITLSENPSIGHGNQTKFGEIYIAYQSYPDIGLYDLIYGSDLIIEDGFWPDISIVAGNKILLVNESFHLNYDSIIYLYNIDTFSQTELTTSGYRGMFSKDGSQIVYIGLYVTNPQSKNLITN